MNKSVYLTTPIYYVNSEPHLGHAYTTIMVDALVRFYKLFDVETRFQTGTDEYGDKIVKVATQKGLKPEKYVTKIRDTYRNLWSFLNVKYDNFIYTTNPYHINTVQAILKKIYEGGDIYFSRYEGLYCVGCERFLIERELVDGKCPDHGVEPVYREESNYFFKMTSYLDSLKKYILANPNFIRPKRYRNEVLSILEFGLDDLCITRPKSRLNWGIEVPFNKDFVTYVWFDALVNYISGLGWPTDDLFHKFWLNSENFSRHIIAKDILKPHAIYWPTILMSLAKIENRELEYYLYKNLNVHGYWKMEEKKISKTRGNIVNPLSLKNRYGTDVLRYFLLREMTFGLDASFDEESLINRYNSDLVNDLGNLFSRILGMLHKYREGVVPKSFPIIEKKWNFFIDENNLSKKQFFSEIAHKKLRSSETLKKYRETMDAFNIQQALFWVWDLIDALNKFIVNCKPWDLFKVADKKKELDHVLYLLCQRLADIIVLVSPIMPETSQRMASILGLNFNFDGIGLLMLESNDLLKVGTRVKELVKIFPRI